MLESLMPVLMPAEDLLATQRLVDFPSLFRCAVARWPDSLALQDDRLQLTYAQLQHRVDAVSRYLIDQGLQPDQCVGLCLKNSAQAVIAMLGVLQAGGVFVPLDPDYPADRLAFMVRDASITMVLCEPRYRNRFEVLATAPDGSAKTTEPGTGAAAPTQSSPPRLIDPDAIPMNDHATLVHALNVQIAPDDRAYVMYTSGSTGMPKGVQIEHRALAAYCFADIEIYKLRADDRTLQFATLNFDIAIEEIFPPLLVGSAVVIRPERRADDTIELSAIIRDAEITALHIAAAYWHQWVDLMHAVRARVPESLRLMIVTGEKVSPVHYHRWLSLLVPGHEPLWCNAYGPTETTVTATVFIPPLGWTGESMPIGKPLQRYEAWILDPQDRPLGTDETGELYIGGDALARGYLNRPEQNRIAFREVAFPDGRLRRVYKTGDLARWLPSGDIEFAGRIDHQIKIGSYRIEPQEIEHHLAQYCDVREALVSYDEVDSHKMLVAYVACGEARLDAKVLADFLAARLPAYMIPNRYVFVSEFPKTLNGKIDRKSLPPAAHGQTARDAAITLPRTDMERQLTEIFADVLQLGEIGIHDDFFMLGGSSLLVARVIMRVQEQLDLPIPVRDFFANPTVATMAQLLARRAGLVSGAVGNLAEQSIPLIIPPKLPVPHPFFFPSQDEDQDLFAIHYPPCGAPLRHAVLICSPEGHEYVRSHRNLQQLALLLSRAGADVLRFDFRAQGNSQGRGEDSQPDQWRRDIADALNQLRQLTEPLSISVVAVRLGATLVSTTPLEDIDHLILIDPVRCGADYLSMLAGFNEYELNSQTRFDRVRRADVEQLHGYRCSATKLAGIRALALPQTPLLKARSTMVLTSRDYEHAEGKLCLPQGWQRQECRDEIYWHRREYTHSAFASADCFRHVLNVVTGNLMPTTAPMLTEPAGRITDPHRAHRQDASVFGRCGNLVGVSILPEAPSQEDLCLVMLTAGMLHHVGPYRLHVDLAKRFADEGVASFRFDLSGIGESLAVGSCEDSLGRAFDETRQALDLLQEQHGFTRFILFGLCSGADDAIEVARMDQRVCGVVLMDGCGFRTIGYHWHRLLQRYLPRLLSADKVFGKLRNLLRLNDPDPVPTSLAAGKDIREFPDRLTAQSQIQRLVDRGTCLRFIYTGGAHDYFNHEGQFTAMFPELRHRGRLSVSFRPQWDHVAYLPEDRQALIDEIADWAQTTFASGMGTGKMR